MVCCRLRLTHNKEPCSLLPSVGWGGELEEKGKGQFNRRTQEEEK